MSLQLLKNIQIMMVAGLSFEYGLETLLVRYPNSRLLLRMRSHLSEGESIYSVISLLFPWWCKYPFDSNLSTIDTISFIHLCQTYIHERYSMLLSIQSILLYPLCLFIFAVLILFVFVNALTFMSPEFKSYIVIFWLVIIMVCFICVVIIYHVLQLLRFNTYDLIFLLSLMINQGCSLQSVLFSLKLPGKYLLHWHKLIDLTYRYQSFVTALADSFSLPVPIKESLLMYESSGDLLKGLNHVSPFFKDLIISRVKRLCIILKCVIYLLVVGVILVMVLNLYQPSKFIT